MQRVYPLWRTFINNIIIKVKKNKPALIIFVLLYLKFLPILLIKLALFKTFKIINL